MNKWNIYRIFWLLFLFSSPWNSISNSKDFSKYMEIDHLIVWSCPFYFYEGKSDEFCDSTFINYSDCLRFKLTLDTFLLENKPVESKIITDRPFIKVSFYFNKEYKYMIVSDQELEYFQFDGRQYKFTDELFKRFLLLLPHDHSEMLKNEKYSFPFN